MSRTVTPLGILKWKTAPFGLKNMPATFQRAMTLAFADELDGRFVGEVHGLDGVTKEMEWSKPGEAGREEDAEQTRARLEIGASEQLAGVVPGGGRGSVGVCRRKGERGGEQAPEGRGRGEGARCTLMTCAVGITGRGTP